MKKQNFKAPLVVSGIVGTLLAALAALFFQLAEPEMPLIKELINETVKQEAASVKIPPLAGHWLRTDRDPAPELPSQKAAVLSDNGRTAVSGTGQGYNSASQITPVDHPPDRYMNRTTDNINIMYVWTDGPQLKVISITSFNKKTRQAAIMVIPLYTRTGNDGSTIESLYEKEGRSGVQKFLEGRLEIKIPNFVHVNQEALRKLSDLVGSFNINGETVTMADAFEQTAAGVRTDDRDIVKAVGARVLTPSIVLKAPKMLWIFTHDIKTNFSTDEMVQLFNLSRRLNLGEMRKITLPGTEVTGREGPYLFVYSKTWKNVIYDVTQ